MSALPPFSQTANGRAPGAGVTAVLGPTNTGKTHLAIERMLAHSSGIIGLPLRLLAREVYNKIVARIGDAEVALITGEEKIKPPKARFWVSTVEAMPRDLDVSFLAVDEIQIATDLERGHVFTDRILNRRGRDETLLLGAATMRPIIDKLLPGASVVTRPRLSQLMFAGDRKITRQPRRTAIVAFSADEVYAIAELIRRQHGGAAVVLGSLSPRTRNAQVDLFQSGDVDYLVATDAIGMGLNLDVDHVAFASDRKYDGYQFRRLTPSEFAQIAGRAGRATRDGTFGTTGRCAPFEPELVDALQSHAFDSVKVLQWRNAKLDFSSLAALQVSLAQVPAHEALARAPVAEDLRVLDHAARDEEVRGLAQGAAAVERLWETCQIPDYRRVAPAAHAELVTTVYGFLMRKGRIPDDWFAAQIAQTDRTDGDIDTLSARIAQIRTWTFAANRPDWLADPDHWQKLTRAVEDKLSDALHERLTERFVDRRTSVLMRRLRENTMLNTEIGKTGEVVVEGHVIGRLDGFMFAPDTAEAGSEAKALQAAALKALAGEIDARAEKLSVAPDDQFVLASDGTLRWTGDAVAKLVAAEDALQPRLRIIADERLTGAPRDAVQARLDLWLKTHITKLLGPLFDLTKAEDITGIARGIAFQLVEALGVLERQKIAAEMKDLDQPSRASLRKYGVRFGAYHIYVPSLLKPAARGIASLLWAQKQENVDVTALLGAQHLAASGRTSFPVDKALNRDAYRVLGYKQCGERAVRVDILERLADLIRPALAWRDTAPGPKPPGAFDGRGFTVTQAMTSLTGSAGEDFASILKALGYRMERRPPLPVVVAAPVAPETEAAATPAEGDAAPAAEAADHAADVDHVAALDTALDHVAEAATDNAPAEASPSSEAPAEPVVDDRVEAAPVAATAAVEAPIAEVAVVEPVPSDVEAGDTLVSEVAAEPDLAAEAADVTASSDAATAEAEASETVASEVVASEVVASEVVASETAGTETAAAEPQLVEVWRPGGRSEERRPRHHHRHARHGRDGTAQAEGGEARDGQSRQRPPRREHRDEPRPPRPEVAAAADAAGSQKGRERDQRNQRGGRDNFKGKFRSSGGGRNDGRPAHGQRERGAAPNPPRERERPIDPNSPFAKLAALREQLAANRKDG
jgi:ATP-dependent RNA helicase SUPV3L1/SUV3